MFVVDDLVGWLIGRLADAGYRKLITRLHGSDLERALKTAVRVAVGSTVDEISPASQKQADRVADQLNKAFGKRDPVALPPGAPTLLEGLQSAIAGQLSVLDDAGQPAVNLLGVPISEVADRLSDHLVREIIFRGSQGGPLTPLASQLNHDLTHLQGRRIEGILAQMLDRAADAAGPVGWPLAEVGDPFALEVHRPVELDVRRPGLPVLPVYVPREHDTALAKVMTAAAAGMGGIAVLVGGSSTGKTRACWQALELLRGLEPVWRLWHPIDPQQALAQLPGAGPRTVVWLNEAQRYLDTSGDAGERVAAGLRTLLRDRARGPVLVLATLWPEFWHGLTTRPPGGGDPHAQARELLDGHNIPVPSAFTGEQLRGLEETGDPRLAQAATGSRDGQVIQYLAGAPDLLDRYHNAPPAARALINAAMDTRRLDIGPALPRAFLASAAPGYMTDTEWNLLPGDWLEQGLGYAKSAQGGPRAADTDPAPAKAGCPGQPRRRVGLAAGRLPRPARPPHPPGPARADFSVGRPTAHTGTASDLIRLGHAAGIAACTATPPLWTTAANLGSIGGAEQLITLLRRSAPAMPLAPPDGPPPTPASITRGPSPGCWRRWARRGPAMQPPPAGPSPGCRPRRPGGHRPVCWRRWGRPGPATRSGSPCWPPAPLPGPGLNNP